jgi:uncharacterized membrane protein
VSGHLRRLAACALAVAATSWAAALAGAPYAAAHAAPRDPAFLAGTAVYGVAGIICHQRPDRSFHAWGVQLPVCARCTGLYAGAAAGALAAVLMASRQRWARLRRGSFQSLSVWRLGLLLAAAPAVAAFLLEQGLPGAASNGARAASGVPLGAAVAWVVVSSLRGRATSADGAPEVDCADANTGRRGDSDR